MRELKFRVWREEDKEYRTDLNVFRLHDGKIICTSPAYSLEGDRFDVEQYTGLKDNKGKEIYEGDIVKFNETICTIQYDETYARYTLRDQSDGVQMFFDALIIIPFEVIGNIHENPELLGDTNVTNKEEE